LTNVKVNYWFSKRPLQAKKGYGFRVLVSFDACTVYLEFMLLNQYDVCTIYLEFTLLNRYDICCRLK